ncbi:MAG: glycogen debranching N-terminal domain-containing protein, partial [Hyphomicrobiaceae bacterium]
MPQSKAAVVGVVSSVVSGEAPFYIPATDAPARPRRTLKHNDTFAVFDSHGDIGASAGGEDGLFDNDTRCLSHLELLVAGSRPLLLHSAVSDDNSVFHVDLTNPDVYADGRIALLKDSLHVSRTIYLREGSLRERIGLRNFGSEEVSITLSLSFHSDFADIFEVRGIKRRRRGRFRSDVISPSEARLSYEGLAGAVRETRLHFEPEPTTLRNGVASYSVTLAPEERHAIFVSVGTRGHRIGPTASFFQGVRSMKREAALAHGGRTSVETTNEVVNEILRRSTADLDMLVTATEDGPYPYAGIPWYSTTFGRDGIITAMQMLWLDPSMATGVLRRLARLQATTHDSSADAAPGKILHEMRGGEMALLGEVPFAQYYGSVDATPLFVMLAGEYAERT